MSIPKIIHQTWKDGNIPLKWEKWRRTWTYHHPDWSYRLWTHEQIDEFIWRHHKPFYGQFKRLSNQIMRVDTFRAFLMMTMGGVYVDLDFEALKPLDSLLAGRRCVIGKEPYEHAVQLYRLDWMPGSAFLASAPGHPFWKHYISCIFQEKREGVNPIFATGPAMLKRAIDTFHGEEITLLEPDLLYPMPNLRNKRLALTGRWASGGDNETASGFPGAFAVHRWQASWLPETQPAKAQGGPAQSAGLHSSARLPDADGGAIAVPPIDDLIGAIAAIRSERDYLVVCRDSTDNSAISIKKATRGLFGDAILVFPEYYSRPVYSTKELNRIAGAIVDFQFDQIILSGFPPFYAEIVLQLKCRAPRTSIKALSHATPCGFLRNALSQRNFKTMTTLCQKGLIDFIGFNKRDLAETVGKLFGIDTVHYFLYTDHYEFEKEANLTKSGPDIGVLAGNELRKNVPVQVVAGLMIDSSRVHMVEGHETSCLPQQDRIEIHPFIHEPADFAKLLAAMDLNLYVTFSESWGLVVSESLIQGVPCLAGNSSGIFDFSEELKSYLVVDEADNPMAVFRKAVRALDNRDRLRDTGIEYIRYLNGLAVKSRDAFLARQRKGHG